VKRTDRFAHAVIVNQHLPEIATVHNCGELWCPVHDVYEVDPGDPMCCPTCGPAVSTTAPVARALARAVGQVLAAVAVLLAVAAAIYFLT
jgi:hypothetical protein